MITYFKAFERNYIFPKGVFVYSTKFYFQTYSKSFWSPKFGFKICGTEGLFLLAEEGESVFTTGDECSIDWGR